MTLFSLCLWARNGFDDLAAQFWGKKDRDSLRAICIALRIAFCLGVAFSLLALLAPAAS